jgi:acetyltransferase-like isoleucine patch superfamily enzyme
MADHIVSPHIRIRHPDFFRVGPYSIIDDFSYFSARVEIGTCSHVASGCSVAGGRDRLFSLGDFSSLSSGVKVWCVSNDFVNDVIAILPPGCDDVDVCLIEGDVIIGNYCGIGANSVVMPDNTIPEGVSVGALSFVPPRFQFEPWSVYAGVPVSYIGPRDKTRVLSQVEEIKKRLAGRRTL